MKFFKHFTDSHRGQTINSLFDEMGHTGPACYWILVEMCAEKLTKGDDEEFTEEHCKFRFHERELRKNLRISPKKLKVFLRICSENSQLFLGNSQLSPGFSGKIIEISMPKLLECLDRDSKRARQRRGLAAPKREREEKEKEKEKEREGAGMIYSPPIQPLRITHPQISNANDLMHSISAVQRDLWDQKFGKAIVEREIAKAFQFHMSDPSTVPRTGGQWMKKLFTWFEIHATKPETKSNFDPVAHNAELEAILARSPV